MDSTDAPSDPPRNAHDELSGLVREFRHALARHARCGAWKVPATDTRVDTAQVEADRPGLPQIRQELGDCTRCGLHAQRTNIVFGNGPARADLMFVGEGPGADEDRAGVPFVGRAGELLDKMIAAMGWQRSEVYVANVVKCRPPDSRTPLAEEIATCTPFLQAQIAAVAPRIIVALGQEAAHVLLGTDAPISSLRGHFVEQDGCLVMPTYHPEFLLRQPEKKREAWTDLQQVMAELDRMGVVAGQARR